MYESEALGGKVTIRTLTPYDAEGPLKLRSGKVTDLAAVVHARMCARARACARAHAKRRANRLLYPSSGSERQAPAIRWYQEVMAQNTSLTNSNYLHQASR